MPSDLSVAAYFVAVPDPRIDRTKKHLLGDILVTPVAGARPAGVRGILSRCV